MFDFDFLKENSPEEIKASELILKDLSELDLFAVRFAAFLKSLLLGKTEVATRQQCQDVFLLFRGGLAAGKTTTISKILKALGANTEASSPTFMGLHEYALNLNLEPAKTKVLFYHLDLYQKNIGLDSLLEFLDSDTPSIWAIEWSEKLDEEILEFLELKKAYIMTLTMNISALEDGSRKIEILNQENQNQSH